uniref:uncharacterized protein n=1 Tax=Myxine glutinosa TaxID=7769 RepID=UPI00358F1BDF
MVILGGLQLPSQQSVRVGIFEVVEVAGDISTSHTLRVGHHGIFNVHQLMTIVVIIEVRHVGPLRLATPHLAAPRPVSQRHAPYRCATPHPVPPRPTWRTPELGRSHGFSRSYLETTGALGCNNPKSSYFHPELRAKMPFFNVDEMPTGNGIFKHVIGIVVCLELVCGALVWILVASTNLTMTVISQGYIMFVSVSFFVITLLWLGMYLFTSPRETNTSITFEAFLITAAFVLYLSASVLQANLTICAVHNCNFSTNNNTSTESNVPTTNSSSTSPTTRLTLNTTPGNLHHTPLEPLATPSVKTTALSAPSRTKRGLELDETALTGREISKIPSLLSRFMRSTKILKEGGISSNTCLMSSNDYRINIAATVFAFITSAAYCLHAILLLQHWKGL